MYILFHLDVRLISLLPFNSLHLFKPTDMDFWRIFGFSRTSFHHHQDPINLPTKDGKEITLSDFCRASTPTCRLNPFLFNGHLQTFWTAARYQDIPIYYKRKVFEAEDPTFAGTFAVDFVVPPYVGEDESLPPRTMFFKDAEFEEIGSLDSKPMLVTLHGLSGGSHEIYLRHVLKPIVEAGWEACVVNSRGCAMSTVTTEVLYNARATWDIRQVVKWLKKMFPNRPLFGIGYSLGANILVNVRIVDELDLRIEMYVSDSSLSSVVPRWRRIELCIESRRSVFKSMESWSWLSSASADMAWLGCLLQDHGNEHESSIWKVYNLCEGSLRLK